MKILSYLVFCIALCGCGAVKSTTPPAALAPGYLSLADQTLGESLKAVKDFAAQETVNYNALPAAAQVKEKTYLNTLITSINVADAAYVGFHEGTQTLAQAQAALTQAQNAQSGLVSAKGVK